MGFQLEQEVQNIYEKEYLPLVNSDIQDLGGWAYNACSSANFQDCCIRSAIVGERSMECCLPDCQL